MPLLDLKTDLTSLKYGHDRPGGGNSGQPFITSDPSGKTTLTVGPNNILKILGINSIPAVPNLSVRLGNSKLGRFAREILAGDTFIRGGALGSIQSSINDTFRIGGFLTTLPTGPLFIIKQVGLQLSTPKLEVKKGLAGVFGGALSPGGLLGTLTGGLLGPTRIYNLGINTLAQVPSNAFGIHFNRHGIGPTQNEDTKYAAVVDSNNRSVNSRFNRLVEYKSKFKLGDGAANRGLISPKTARVINTITGALGAITGNIIPKISPTPGQLVIDDYLTGPGSTYGIGRTRINRYDFTEDGFRIQESLSNSTSFAGKSRKNNNPESIDYSKATGDKSIYQDPKKSISTYTGVPLEPNNINTAITNGTVDTYNALKKKIKTDISQPIPFVSGGYFSSSYGDAISTKDISITRDAPDFKYYGNVKTSASGSKREYDVSSPFERQDASILTVVFRAINPFEANQQYPERWIFSAYMTGFKDNFNATWNDINYAGRAESFYIYNKFKRNVSFNLKIPCFNKIQLFEKHRALGQLASTTAGSYNGNGLLAGVLLKVNVGNYLVGEYAVLNSLNYSIPDDASWDISNDALLAMYLDVNVDLTIIHRKLPEYEQSGPNTLKNGFFGYLPNPENSTQAQRSGFITGTKIAEHFTTDVDTNGNVVEAPPYPK